MATETGEGAEVVLENFVEAMFRLMMDNHHRRIAELELTGPQLQALRLLRQGPACTGELAAALRISAPAVTQLTDRLMRKHLIERRQADGDRRSVIVSLTMRGRRAVDKVRECRNDVFCGALANLSDRDREMVVLALGKMVTALERYETQTADQPYAASKTHSRARKGLMA
ncbi:MAG TPA: MarR family transcriptional regulator [Blastocatellia bacterium]|nr:MarR family transcriptional regulator [Blastocatellia bacterium]